MAQTKRKRRTKHRGNAAGTVEVRGRTGRPPSAEEKKRVSKDKARELRLSTPPTWQSSGKRAGLACVCMFVLLVIINHSKTGNRFLSAAIFAVLAFVLYVPLGYYLEVFMFRRRMAKQGQVKP